MLSRENLTEDLAPPPVPVDVIERALDLDQQQKQRTSGLFGKVSLFVATAALGHTNPLELYILEHEPNDCAFVKKYLKITTVDTSAVSTISVDSVTLHTLHAPHPLLNFAKEEPLPPDTKKEVQESPVLLFIHGLGGQISQFEPLMGLLSQCSEIYALDLPGFGDSRLNFALWAHKFEKQDEERIAASIALLAWPDFTTDNIVQLIIAFIEQNIPDDKKIILIGHSMGTHLLIKTAAKLPPGKTEGLVLLSPPPLAEDIHAPKGHSMLSMLRVFTYFPSLFNLFRLWDRSEGLSSASVLRQLPTDCSAFMKIRQLRWNMDIDTNVILRYINGFAKATNAELVQAISKFNDNPKDTKVYEKTLLIGGLEDKVTPVKIVDSIHEYLVNLFGRKVSCVTKIKNAGHSLLLVKPEFISGMVLNHLELKFPERLHLSPAWVLKLKADISGDKWGLKNELKWSETQLISYNITRRNGKDVAPLLGMKTLRESDSEHSPREVERRFYGDTPPSQNNVPISGRFIAIVDISADIPPYSPKSFQHIQYYKCATVSKVVPDHAAVRRFIQLIDDILSENTEPNPLVGVHCHYGFNRTGFLICCYLVERCGWSVHEAVTGFRAAKPPGIKHPHFIDALYVRYE